MPVIGVAASRGCDLMRVAQLLAINYESFQEGTAFVEVLDPGEPSLFLAVDAKSGEQRRLKIPFGDTALADLLELIVDNRDERTVLIDFGKYREMAVSPELQQALDILLLPTIPAQPSVADSIRVVDAIFRSRASLGDARYKVEPWVIGAGCAGGLAIEARLRDAAARAIDHLSTLTVTADTLPILHWGLPWLHWSTIDALVGLGITQDTGPLPHHLDILVTLFRQIDLLTKEPDKAPSIERMRESLHFFYEPGRFNDLRTQAECSGELAEDLSLIDNKLGPLPQDLAQNACLDEWAKEKRTYPILQGTVSDHPDLMDGDFIRTSLLERMAPDLSWARTNSRYYRLSRAVGEAIYARTAPY